MENNKIKNYFAIGILVICLLSLIVGAFNTTINGIKANNEKAKNLQNILGNTSPKIAIISLNGMISADSGEGTNIFAEGFGEPNVIKTLKMAKEDNSVKAIILKINSPGGTVATSQNIYYEIMRTRQIKPVVALMEDVAASGGYYVASAADRIVAQEGTLTGSIGVIMQMMDAHRLFTDKLGLQSNVIKSGAFKDAGSATREMTTTERQLFQNIVNDAYGQFVLAIEKGRIQRSDSYSIPKQNLTKNTLKKYADGRIFTGQQAYNYGFVDILGDTDVAQKVAAQMASEKFHRNFIKLPAINYNPQPSFSQILFGATESLFKNDGLKSYLPNSMNMSKQPLYLWE